MGERCEWKSGLRNDERTVLLPVLGAELRQINRRNDLIPIQNVTILMKGNYHQMINCFS